MVSPTSSTGRRPYLSLSGPQKRRPALKKRKKRMRVRLVRWTETEK